MKYLYWVSYCYSWNDKRYVVGFPSETAANALYYELMNRKCKPDLIGYSYAHPGFTHYNQSFPSYASKTKETK